MIPSGNYLLVGRTGIGKSSLVNTIAQTSLAPVDCSYVCTKAITAYAFDTPAGSYVLYDSPGFCEDDNPKTDAQYLSSLKIFLNRQTIESCPITILFAVRLGGTRIRSEDHEVITYLAELLLRFRLSVVLTATWADFTCSNESVHRILDLTRIQYLAMIDRALLELSGGKLCAAGFEGAYAVDNQSAAWISSWKPLVPRRENLVALESYEVEVGHPVSFISKWISAGGRDPHAFVAAGDLDLLAARIENLTRYPLQQDLLLPDFLGMSFSGSSHEIDQIETIPETDHSETQYEMASTEALHDGFRPYIYVDDANLLSALRTARNRIEQIFRIRSLNAGESVLRSLSESHAECCTLLRPILSGRDLSSQVCSHVASLYATKAVLEGLYICLNRNDVAIFRSRTLSGDFLLEERLACFGTLLSSLFSLVGRAYLVDETTALTRACFSLPRCHQFGHVKKHFLNCIELLYLSVISAEWSLLPRPLDFLGDEYWTIDSDDILNWIEDSAPFYGYSELVLKVFRAGDWGGIVDLAMVCPNSMPGFVEDIIRSLSRRPLLVSEEMIRAIDDQNSFLSDDEEVPF